MIALRNARLEIQIQEPGKGYDRTRFDWGGICRQITLDGRHTFLSQEASEHQRGTEGVGLSDEFGISTPVGYDETDVGAWFPKIGVGFLQKTAAAPYDFMHDYPVQPVEIEVEAMGSEAVTFWQVSDTRAGWGWKLQKTLSLAGQTLTIDYGLENTGERTLCTETYNHNFLQIDSGAIGPDYALQVSFPLQLTIMDGPLRAEGGRLNPTETLAASVYAQQPDCDGLHAVAWSLIHQPTGHGLRVREQFELHKFAFWAMQHVLSPEFFLWIDLKPGQKQTWERVYEFF